MTSPIESAGKRNRPTEKNRPAPDGAGKGVISMILKKSKDSGDYSCDKGNDNALDDTSRSLRYFFMFLGSFLGALIATFLAGLLI